MALNFSEVTVGSNVSDTWWRWWGVGIVTKIGTTRVSVRFPALCEVMVYDKEHAEEFLELVK